MPPLICRMGGRGGLPHTKRAKMVQKLEKKRTERASQKDHKDILGRYVQGAKFIKHLFLRHIGVVHQYLG